MLTPEEKAAYKFVPPPKEPSAEQQQLEYLQAQKRRKVVDKTQGKMDWSGFLRRQFQESRPFRIRDFAAAEAGQLSRNVAQDENRKLKTILPVLPLTIENVKHFEELTKMKQRNLSQENAPKSQAEQKTANSKRASMRQTGRVLVKQQTDKKLTRRQKAQKESLEEKDENFMELDRENQELIEHFKRMCQEKNLRLARLTRGKFKAFLTGRYKGQVADKMVQCFGPYFQIPMDFEFFCDAFE